MVGPPLSISAPLVSTENRCRRSSPIAPARKARGAGSYPPAGSYHPPLRGDRLAIAEVARRLGQARGAPPAVPLRRAGVHVILDAAETLFSARTRRCIKRSSVLSIVDLRAAVKRYMAKHKDAPKPVTSTMTSNQVLDGLNPLNAPRHSLGRMSKRSRSHGSPSTEWHRRCLPIKEKPIFCSIRKEARLCGTVQALIASSLS
jgi:hypothetical protein